MNNDGLTVLASTDIIIFNLVTDMIYPDAKSLL